MLFYIFTDNRTIEKNFNPDNKKLKISIEFHPYDQLRKEVKKIEGNTIIYLDIKDREEDYIKDIKYLAKKEDIFFAILDPKGLVTDIGGLFHSGAVDYLAKDEIEGLLTSKRLKGVNEYIEKYRYDFDDYMDEDEVETGGFLTVSGWNEIKQGNEYTFTLMYVELDDKDKMEKMYNKENLKTALGIFRYYLERYIQPYNGRIWMWSNFGGIILFPYTGNPCESVISMFKITLYKFLHDVEESSFPNFISFRIALHLGNIVYRNTQTGTIISDTINSIFHLGKRFTKPGQVTLTEEIVKRAPKQLKTYFVPAGEYEGRRIFRMKLPKFIV